MRALYIKNIQLENGEQEVPLDSSQLHHIVKVSRIRINEKLLILNGIGDKYIGTLLSVNKKSIIFNLLEHVICKRKYNISIALCLPKKDAFEESIKNSIELGAKKILTYKSLYSQYEISEINTRLQNLITSAVQQSNNPFSPEILFTKDLNELEFDIKSFTKKFYFSSRELENNSVSYDKILDDALVLIGPEGGLSESEEEFLIKLGFEFIHLPTPIMRTPQAVVSAISYFLSF